VRFSIAAVLMQVQQVFDDMYTAGLQPNIMTYVTLLSSYAELGNWQYAMQVLNHMCQPKVWFSQSLLHAFCRQTCQTCTHTETQAAAVQLVHCVTHCVQLENNYCCDSFDNRHYCVRHSYNPVQSL